MAPSNQLCQRARLARAADRLVTIWALVGLSLGVDPANAQARGYMLYSQYCVECHTAQVHWRDARLATDWKSLNLQVRRWQAVAFLNWNEEDIQNVTRYLNTRYYDFWPPTEVGVMPVTVPRGPRRDTAEAR